MAKPNPEKKPLAATSAPMRVLPMELQVGDRLVDETAEWEVMGRRHSSSPAVVADRAELPDQLCASQGQRRGDEKLVAEGAGAEHREAGVVLAEVLYQLRPDIL